MKKNKHTGSTLEKEFKPTKLKGWLIPKLRRLSYMWPERNESKRRARIERGKYQCNICKQTFGSTEVVLDHINPIVNPEEGWQDFGVFVESLFCPVEGFQVCCNPCHDAKTKLENEQRKLNKKLDSK